MASTLQTVLSEDLESALAKFVTEAQIDSKSSLHAAIIDLLEALQSTNTDVASLLTAVACKVDGLLEVVIVSRNGAAFTFRSRVLKALQKSTQYPNPIFITCTQRIGAFLIRISPSITVDQDILTKHREFSTNVTSTGTTESGDFGNKEVEPPEHVLVEPSKTTRSGIRHQRASSVTSTIQDTGRHRARSRRATTGVPQQPPSPTVATNRSWPSTALLEQIKGCLESYFTACLEDGVEEFAVDRLFQLLVPVSTALQPLDAPDKTIPEPLPFPAKDLAQSPSRSLSQGTIPLAGFLDNITKHDKIAQVFWEAGDYVNAVHRFRQSDAPSSPRQASRCILEGIRSNVPLGTSYGNESDILSELFTLSRTAILTPEEKVEIEFLGAVVHLDSVQLKRYGQHFLEKQDLRGALLALDAWSQSGTLGGIRSMRDDEIAEVLLLCRKFGTVINTLVRTPGFVDLPDIQPIFGVSNTSSHKPARQPWSQDITLQRTIQPCSFVHNFAFILINRGRQLRGQTDPIILPTNTVDDMIRRALLRRLNAVVERVDELSRKSRGFELCRQFLINQQCGRRDEGSCWKDHVMDRDLTIERFNSQFRIHILVISVLNHFTATPGTSDEKARSIKQKIWLSKLFTLCYPSTSKVGCLSDITPALIPEYSTVMPIVQGWLREAFLGLRPADRVESFLNNILITSLLATAFNYSESVTYLWRGQWSLDPESALQNGLIQSNTKPITGSAIIWLSKGTPTRIHLGINFLNHVLNTGQVHLDAEIALVFAEEVCGQLILNHYAHNYSGYDYLAMPRSWIVRAFARGQSPQVNGSNPWTLATTLDTFLNILLLKKSAGKLQMRGSPLWEVSYAVRSQAAQRICRCLALIGQNIIGVRFTVLAIFKELGTVSPLRPEFQRFALANDWDKVLDALVESTKTSTMDELFMIRRDVGYPSIRPRFKPVVCLSERDIFSKLRLTQYPPAIALQSEILCPGASQIGSEKQGPGLPGISAPKQPAVEAPRLESVASTPEDRRSASIIQAFFRRHRRRAGGPTAAVFERLAKKLQERTRSYQLERRLLLCIRGPLPHVLAYLRIFKQRSEDTIQTLNQDMQESSHEHIEELHAQGIEVRRIRDATIRLIKELQPSSDFYFNRRSGAPVSVLEIVERVRQIPELVRSLQNLVECSEDLDYELGVEPILSDRAPWALEVSTSGVNERPPFS